LEFIKGHFQSPLGWFFLVVFTLTIYKRSLIVADLIGTEAKNKRLTFVAD